MKIRIGSRGSNLALIQSKWVEAQIKKAMPGIETEIIIIKTKGDKILDIALDKIGDKGLFVKELEQALFDDYIDIAVHSMKDMPSDMPNGLSISKTPYREDHRDVLILREGLKTLEDVPKGGIIGTGSKRRCFQLSKLRPDLRFDPVRGNIETRISKIKSMNLDGIVLAAAGIHRLGLDSVITSYLDNNTCLAAPAQGALAIQYRTNDSKIESYLENIVDYEAQVQIEAERAFLKYTNGGCHVPVGAYAELKEDRIKLTGLFGTEDGKKIVKKSIEGKKENSTELGKELAEEILRELGLYEG